jgi:replicative superfamily II helicase
MIWNEFLHYCLDQAMLKEYSERALPEGRILQRKHEQMRSPKLPPNSKKGINTIFKHFRNRHARYTSRSLLKISSLVSDPQFKKRLGTLQKMVRYGIKSDLAESGLMELPSLSRDKKRNLARSLFASGIDSVNKLAKQRPKTLARNFRISHELADSLISDAKQQKH